MPSFFELVTKVLILFFVFSCLLDLYSLYCSVASFENKGLFTSLVSSLINSIKSQSVASLCSSLQTFITSQTHLSLRFPESFESSIQITYGVSRGIPLAGLCNTFTLDQEITKFLETISITFLTCGQPLISFLYIVIVLYGLPYFLSNRAFAFLKHCAGGC